MSDPQYPPPPIWKDLVLMGLFGLAALAVLFIVLWALVVVL